LFELLKVNAMFSFNVIRHIALLCVGIMSSVAWAHMDGNSLHDHATFTAGLMHPFSGLDHLAAMVAVGVWSAMRFRHGWFAPVVFVIAMVVGIVVGMEGFNHAAIEPMVAASVMLMGVLVAYRHALSVGGALAMVAGFGLCHGATHGLALEGTQTVAPVLGMVVATAMLHAFGVFAGYWAKEKSLWLQRVFGAGFALLGLALLSRFA
jgi:urease accessory protein